VFGRVIIINPKWNDQWRRDRQWFRVGERVRFWFGYYDRHRKQLWQQFNQRQHQDQNEERCQRIWFDEWR
jgi:hypothetical protein